MNGKLAKRIRRLAKEMGHEKYSEFLKAKHKMSKEEFFSVLRACENLKK